ncbi:taste receptor type 2 member 16-like [Chrysemys picta bellii]|uniref:taste receptor type 2 member 16-like n=1 Tax=Chrysemys picta bellii TaxID=8478 RepID=UPI0032B1B5B9
MAGDAHRTAGGADRLVVKTAAEPHGEVGQSVSDHLEETEEEKDLSLLVNYRTTMSGQCDVAMKKANAFLECIRFQTAQLYIAIWLFINQMSLCFASCLSVFYCVKIATFNQSLFSWLKLKISKLVPWLLLGSVLYCLVTTVAFTLFSYSYCLSSHNSTDRLSTNSTMSDKIKNLMELTFLIHSVGSIFPLIVFIVSSVLLIISLWRHIRKMNLNSDLNPNFRNPSTDAHVRALKSVVSFFIVYNIYYVASTFSIGNISYLNAEWKMRWEEYQVKKDTAIEKGKTEGRKLDIKRKDSKSQFWNKVPGRVVGEKKLTCFKTELDKVIEKMVIDDVSYNDIHNCY